MIGPALVEALGRIVGPKWVRHRRAELRTYTMDGLPTRESYPGAVVMPGTAAQVREIVRLLHLTDVPFVARGAGTGLSGGAVADPDAVLTRLGISVAGSTPGAVATRKVSHGSAAVPP